MDPKALAIIALRSLAILFSGQGAPKQAETLRFVADGIEAGADVDDHMRRVAAALKASEGGVNSAQWDDVHARIAEDSARLQAR